MIAESAFSAQSLLTFTFLNALAAVLVKVKITDVFGRPLRLDEFVLFVACILFVPVCGLFWIALELLELESFSEFRATVLPAAPVCAMLLVMSWHGAVHFVFNTKRD